jgi:hypothetical protein
MNIHLIKSDIENLTHTDKKSFIDFLIFLHWSEMPFRDTFDQCFLAAYLIGNLPRCALPGFLIDLCFSLCILHGALTYTRMNGFTNAWLRIAGAYRY